MNITSHWYLHVVAVVAVVSTTWNGEHNGDDKKSFGKMLTLNLAIWIWFEFEFEKDFFFIQIKYVFPLPTWL